MMLENIPYSEYAARPGVRNSELQHMLRSPAHYREYTTDGGQDTEARAVGRALHTMVLEPEAYEERFTVRPKMDRRTKAGKAAYVAFLASLGDRTGLTLDQAKHCQRMADAIRTDPLAQRLLALPHALSEASIFWTRNELACKARLDHIGGTRSSGVLVEIKTAENANPAEFPRVAFRLGYHRQLAWYLWALEAVGYALESLIAVLLVVEKQPPYCVVVYQASAGFIARGQREMDDALGRLKSCLQADEWPGYAITPLQMEVPAWASK